MTTSIQFPCQELLFLSILCIILLQRLKNNNNRSYYRIAQIEVRVHSAKFQLTWYCAKWGQSGLPCFLSSKVVHSYCRESGKGIWRERRKVKSPVITTPKLITITCIYLLSLFFAFILFFKITGDNIVCTILCSGFSMNRYIVNISSCT